MDSDTIWRHIDTQRTELADLLETLPADAWRTPSLCAAWAVRDVAAHLTFSHARIRDVVGPALRTGFRYNAMIEYAAVHSSLTHEQIVATLRGFVGSRRRAPFVSELEPLLDVLVHTQDIVRPLGRQQPAPVSDALAVVDYVWNKGFPYGAQRRLRGVRLSATDAAWSAGSGWGRTPCPRPRPAPTSPA